MERIFFPSVDMQNSNGLAALFCAAGEADGGTLFGAECRVKYQMIAIEILRSTDVACMFFP